MLSPDDREISSVNGNYEKTYGDVVWFWSDRITFNNFPRNLKKVFKRVDYIHIRFGNISSLTKSDLEPLGSNLRILRLRNNYIEAIESDLFEANQNLEEISLDVNQIEFVGKGAFDKLQKLAYLNFNPNPCNSNTAYNRAGVIALVKKLESDCTDRPETLPPSAFFKQEKDVEEIITEFVKCKVESLLQDIKIMELEKKVEDFKVKIEDRTAFETKNCGKKF